MRHPSQSIAARAAVAAVALVILAVAACSTPRALPVDCDGDLRPINVPAAPAGMLSHHAGQPAMERGS